ncbi:hypothetical protein LCGC14_0979450 [marine sediment metagenome]|uniref:Uncharacterized protein n=1 Tax=marine sediment metagenome TaxID=412755 RepID=A0A0F9N975_9ZZZZ
MKVVDRIRGWLTKRDKRIRLRRETDVDGGNPPWWLRVHSRAAGSIAERRPQPLIKCPSGHRFGVLGAHGIDDQGRVSPRVGCPEEGCGWAALVELEGWAR